MLKVPLKKLRENAHIPTRGSSAAAGYDLYACLDEPVVIEPHTTVKIGTGITAALPDGYFAACFARSGLASRQGLRPANCVGVIDADYFGAQNEGHIHIKIVNANEEGKTLTVRKGEAFAQGIFLPFGITVDDDASEVRTGGFGSTDKR